MKINPANIPLATKIAFDQEDLDMLLEGWGHQDAQEFARSMRRMGYIGKRR